MYADIIKDFQKLKNPDKARILRSFFKTGKGEYGEGDIFLGITVPKQRTLAKKYVALKFSDLQKLLNSKIHEYRLTALLILTYKYNKSDETVQKKIYEFYLKNTRNINNWDLVDTTTPRIIGEYLLNKDKNILYKLAKSKNLWERRISILATFTFIKHNQYNNTIAIAHILRNDSHDLIHKAVGWMLREMGKKNLRELENFLAKHYQEMPRTMLRYAIEKFPEVKRKKYKNPA